MGSQAHLLCCGRFDGLVRERHMGGTYVTTDLGRPLIFRSEANNWEWGLPGNGGAKSWGDPEWHEYALQPDGRYEGDYFHADESKPFAEEKKRQVEGYDFESWSAIQLMNGRPDSFWEAVDVVEPLDGPIAAGGSWGNPYDEEDDLRDPIYPVDLAHAYEGGLVELQVEEVLSGGVRFFPEFVEEDELVGGQKSVRIPMLVKKPSLPFLEGETITARVVGVSTTPPKKKERTLDGRKYVFLLVEVIAWR